jgi:hypothetical protein
LRRIEIPFLGTAAAAAAAAPAGVVAAVSALGPDGGGAVDGSSVGAVPEPVTVVGFNRRPKEKTRFTAWLIQAFGDGYGTRTATMERQLRRCLIV